MSLFVKNIPMPKLVIVEVYAHFKAFGEVTAINLDDRKLACTVHYKTPAQAEAAA